ncbi:MAG: PEP-CTERM sorting domain-containing protein [Pseudomonadales bacterium]|nr:PEP-CTERM sorting domain-containing protein [Pseudomonadales bacterium]
MIFTSNAMAGGVVIIPPTAVPEPSSFALFGLGLATLAFSRKLKANSKK